ncbi:DUF930 domain-containing protein [Mesorhizobium shangrilense]|uniref:DUF930 domain-containing protein n=1 Tax=Mesorhizobium shangrilense TaxID=460060 RepID=A0ABV2DN19_9HYPH
MPPLFRSTSGKMKDEARQERRDLLWGLSAALILHALIMALLVYGLPTPPQQPQEEQAVNVALVPPPEQPKPKPAPAPPPKETKVDKPPKPKVEKPPEPKVEKPPEPKVEKPPPPEKQPSTPSPIEVLKPVFQFGDKDTGPRKALDGASAQDNSPPPAKKDDSKPSAAVKDAENKTAASADSEQRADPTKAAEKPVTAAKETEPTQEKQATPDADKQAAAAPAALAATGGDGEIELPTSAEAPLPRPADAPKPSPAKAFKSASGSAGKPSPTDAPIAASQGYSGLPGVRKLYSQGATGDALATTSMAGVPRGERAAQLCSSALERQLLDASYFPVLIPKFSLKSGNVLDVPDTALPTATTVYRLSYRCEVDANATKVLSLAFSVGTPIPPDEWASYGLSAH